MLQATFAIRMIDAINARESILPGLQLGFSVADTCRSPAVALAKASAWADYRVEAKIQGEENMNRTNDYCPVDVVVGGFNSRVTLPLASHLQLYGIPMIDVSATLGDLSDRSRYNLFARVSPSDKFQATAIADLTQTLGHECVHLVYSKGLYGEMGSEDLKKDLASRNICIATEQMATTTLNSTSSLEFEEIVNKMKEKESAKAVICFCEDTTLEALFAALKMERGRNSKTSGSEPAKFVVIAGDYWFRTLSLAGVEDVAAGGVSTRIGLPTNETAGIAFQGDYIMSILQDATANPWLV